MQGSVPIKRFSIPLLTNANKVLPQKLKDFLHAYGAVWHTDYLILDQSLEVGQDRYVMEIYKEELIPIVEQFILEHVL
jgi:hypothetical protein